VIKEVVFVFGTITMVMLLTCGARCTQKWVWPTIVSGAMEEVVLPARLVMCWHSNVRRVKIFTRSVHPKEYYAFKK